ncbi:uncharacterized protein LOC124371608 [Homalodisca vitripennis]|uniref:uncharacterized protein LOC124371608 n=1 Tax=Homalodisca vitripennis TaxID=197043 RepID=UPI001EEC7B79|nr:uncharacterized protein LOC124371608 [Homalodisca vitripennis]
MGLCRGSGQTPELPDPAWRSYIKLPLSWTGRCPFFVCKPGSGVFSDTKLPKLGMDDIQMVEETIAPFILSAPLPDLKTITQLIASKSITNLYQLHDWRMGKLQLLVRSVA